MIPTNVNICGHDFKVSIEDPGKWSSDGMGKGSLIDQMILLREGMGPDTMLSTLLHEAIHMAAYVTDVEMTEAQVSVAALGSLGVLQAIMNMVEIGRYLQPDEGPSL